MKTMSDWWSGNCFVEDMGKRVRAPVQIASENRPYAFHIRQYFGHEG